MGHAYLLRRLGATSPLPLQLAAVALPLAATLGCGGDDPGPASSGAPPAERSPAATVPEGTAPAWSGEGLSAAGGQDDLVLDRLPATFSFPASNLPEDAAAATTFTFTAFEEGGRGWQKVELPFRVPEAQRRFAPEGMRVFADGEEIPFTAGGGARGGAWRFKGDHLLFRAPGEVSELRIEHPEVNASTRRMNWSEAEADGLTPEAFARFGITLKDQAREGLLLPAPTTATWSGLTLPEGAEFRTWLALAPSPILGGSDGADIALELTVDGSTEVIDTTSIEAGPDRFTPWIVDLSAHAGQTIDLTLRTSPGDSPDYDYVFAGSPAVVGTADPAVRRVIVIGIDTLRPDHLSVNGYQRDTTPELDAWAEDAVIFDRAWTSAPRTRPSFRAATTGRLPLEAVCAKNIGEVFDEAGFATGGIVSNIHLNPRFDFHKGFDFWWLDGKAQTDDQVKRAKRFLADNEGRDAYLFMHIMDPHIFYRAPDPYGDKYTADLPPLTGDEALPRMFNRWQVYKWDRAGQLTDNRKAWIEALYDGELSWTSHVLGGFLTWLDEQPGDTAVVIHSDHGEEFWEHGGFEHNHTLYDDTTRGLLWIKPPGGTGQSWARSQVPATLQDIAPTLYDLAGLSDTPPSDGESLVPALRGEADDSWTRPIPIGHLRYDADRWGVVWDDHKYVLVTGTGEEELYDLSSDPGETKNLAGSMDTEPWWRKMAESHGVPVGPGWRVRVDLPPEGGPFTLDLPAKAVGAGVLDPEVITRHPVNQVWGETPRKLPDDTAEVSLSDDGLHVTLTPGSDGEGVVWVMFEEATPAEGWSVTHGDTTSAASGASLTASGATFEPTPGVVLVPPTNEAERMQACATGDDVDAGEVDMLKALGYVGEEGADGH